MANSYITTSAIQVSGVIIPPKTRLDDGDRRLESMGKAEVKRLVEQGYLRVMGLRAGLEPGARLVQHPPLPTGVKTNVTGDKVRRVEYGDPENGGKVLDLTLPTRVGPVERDPSTRPEPAPRRREPGQPKGKWNLDPAAVADKDIDTLNVLVADIDPEREPFQPGDEVAARELLTRDFLPEGDGDEPTVRVEGDVDAGDKASGPDEGRVTRAQRKTTRKPPVKKRA